MHSFISFTFRSLGNSSFDRHPPTLLQRENLPAEVPCCLSCTMQTGRLIMIIKAATSVIPFAYLLAGRSVHGQVCLCGAAQGGRV